MNLKPTTYNLKPQKGFTLIEAVVATAVFAFVVSSTVGVYLSVLKLDRKSRGQRAVFDNGRFIMEFVGKEIRNGTIQYSAYPAGTTAGRTDLYLTNVEGVLEHFTIDANGNVVLDKAGVGTTNLTTGGVKASVNSKFLVSPATDPYTLAKSFNEQPHVTVLLQLTSKYGANPADEATINLQSTFATRTYTSRSP